MATVNAGVAEVGTVPSINFVDSLFEPYPRDERFANVAYTQINSVTSLDGSDKLVFTIQPFDPPIAVDISDILIKVQVKLTTEKGQAIPKDKLVFPVNNSALSMFESLGKLQPTYFNILFNYFHTSTVIVLAPKYYFTLSDLKINDQTVTKSSSYYNYRSYVQSLVSFDDMAKSSNLFLSGWLTDDPETLDGIGHIEPSMTNESMLSRNAWFRKNLFKPKSKSDYSEDGFTFVAPLKVYADIDAFGLTSLKRN